MRKPSYTEMSIFEINPFVRYVAKESFTPLMRAVRAYDYRMFFVQIGECSINILNKNYNLSPGSMVVIKPGDEYVFSIKDKFEIIDINFDYTQDNNEIKEGIPPSFTEEFNEEQIIGKINFTDCKQLCGSFVIHNMEKELNYLMEIVNEFRFQKVLYRQKADALFKTIMCDIARNFAGEGIIAVEKLDNVLNYIKNHYAENLSNNSIAQKAGYHSYYLNRLIKAYTGNTIRQYIINCRIDEAKRFIANTDMQIEQIAEKCGFKNMSHFSSCFKSKVGMSALCYREKTKNIF